MNEYLLEKGYLYSAFGSKYINEALISLTSLKKHFPNAHATLITDKYIDNIFFDLIIYLDDINLKGERYGKNQKLLGLIKTPYYKTFFIDTDTYFCESCVELFYLLDFYDVLAATAPADIRLVEKEKNKIIGYYPYNSGVMLYKKNEKVLNFIKEWHKIFIKKYNIYYGDQPALMEALLYHDIKIYALSNIYNFRSPYYNGITGDKVKIIHGRSEDYELLEKELNRYTGNRIWDPINKKIIFPNQ